MKSPRNFKRLVGNDRDYSYLLRLEQYKLKRMAKCFAKYKRVVGWEQMVKECKLAVKLLDIVLEQDSVFNHWLHESCWVINPEDGQSNIKKFPRHINIRNAERFVPTWESFDSPIDEALKVSLRQRKAWYLYNKLRYYKMQDWWD